MTVIAPRIAAAEGEWLLPAHVSNGPLALGLGRATDR